jgi:hypothetical protein
MAEERLKRDAFIYLHPNGDKQCGTCRDWMTNDQCAIHGPAVKVPATASCGLYVFGDPITDPDHFESHAIVTPEESGLVDRPVRCENCYWGGPAEYECELFHQLNRYMPEIFALDTAIEPTGCCNAQQAREDDEEVSAR